MRMQLILAKDDLLNMRIDRDTVIEVALGAIWFTVGGTDVVLGTGQRWVAPNDDNVLIQSMLPSSLSIRKPARLHSGWARVRQLIGA
ncbi:MAG: hypothetical protein JO142_14740 [Burkholderiales bacterium]|nr:hypothetical protein [Burkholderiales bacterium]